MPGFAWYLSSFYKRRELYFRIGIYVSAASMAGAFGGLLATALTRIPRWGTDSTRKCLIHQPQVLFLWQSRRSS